MPLSDFTPERVKVEYKGRLLASVRGLCLDDLSLLVRGHLDTLRHLYRRSQGEGDMFTRLNQDGFLLRLLTEAPGIAVEVISLASDEPDSTAQVRMLPIPLQVKLLQTIIRLTFEDVGGPKAFVALIGSMIGEQPNPAGAVATTQ